MEPGTTVALVDKLRASLANAVDLLGDVKPTVEMRTVLQEATDYLKDPSQELVELRTGDSAIVIRENADHEIYLPHDEEGGVKETFSAAVATYVIAVLQDDELQENMDAFFQEMAAELDNPEAPEAPAEK